MRTHLIYWLAGVASAQFGGWTDDQVNTSICTWSMPRVALVRDTVYLDGGNLYWSRGLSDGRFSVPTDTGNFVGQILTYNLSEPFDAETNVTGILLKNSVSKAMGGSGNAAAGGQLNFVDGGMLSNDAQFYMYGGAAFTLADSNEPPDGDEVLGYMVYEYGPEKGAWVQGFDKADLDDGVNRYVTYGAAVSAPSENKAWYFSGMTSPTGGHLRTFPGVDGEGVATEVSDRLIQVDFEVQMQEEWSNNTLPDRIRGRAGAEAVWVPVGDEGILVILGGVTHPGFANLTTGLSDDEEASEEESPEFMQTIDIYDIANDEWYRQETVDGPGARARGCAVVAPASDYSSFNIYYYGGYDGIHDLEDFSDAVWVLSLPSFTWTELNEGSSTHGRSGHKCVMPYPDQMMALGGETPKVGATISCLEDGPVVIFNLTSGTWMESYHPDEHGDYGVPEKVRDKIGGDATGGATLTTPSPSGWADDGLEEVFGSSYDQDKITFWGPYAAEPTDSDRPDVPDERDDDGGGGGGLPDWVAPVLGVILGLMLVTGAIVVFCLWRRRKIFKNRSSDYGTEDSSNRIMSWLKGHPTEKAPTVTASDDTPRSPDILPAKAEATVSTASPPPTTSVEAASSPIYELHDTSPPAPPAELSDTGLSPVDVIQKHSHLASDKSRSMSQQSSSSFLVGGVDYASNISRSSLGADSGRADSPSVPGSREPGASQGHMRSLSETLAGHEAHGLAADQRQRPEGPDRRESDQLSPVSPPTADEISGEDYISARSTMVSPLRRSVFHENEEDLGKRS